MKDVLPPALFIFFILCSQVGVFDQWVFWARGGKRLMAVLNWEYGIGQIGEVMLLTSACPISVKGKKKKSRRLRSVLGI